MTFVPIVRIFILALNASLFFGLGLILSAAASRRFGRERPGFQRALSASVAIGMLLFLAANFVVPSISFSVFSVPSDMMRVTPLSPASTPGSTVGNIPAVITPVLSSVWSWAAAVWMIISAVLMIRLAFNLGAAGRVGKEGMAVRDERILSLFRESSRFVGCRRRVVLKFSPRASAPSSLGLIRAVVLLPKEMISWTDGEIRAVLCHELSHVKNRDLFWRMSVRAACAVFWFNPAAWLALRRLIAGQEIESDRAAVRSGTRPSQYAGTLLKTLLGKKSEPYPAMAFFSLLDVASAGPRITTITKVRSNNAQSSRSGFDHPKSGIWMDEDTHRWGWY